MPTAAKLIIIVTFALIYMGVFIYFWGNLARGEEYYNLAPLTTDPHVEHNEGLQPPYWQDLPRPNILPLECGIERETPLSAYMQQRLYMGDENHPNGLDLYFYDTNEDGRADVQISIPYKDENRYPLYYYFDRDYVVDEYGVTGPEIGWIDEVRDGTCKGIRPYWTPQIERERAEDKYRESDCVTGDCDHRQKGEL